MTWRIAAIFDLFIEGDESALRGLFNEAGGHRWQLVPPTERKGRVHTSTVTVAVFEIKPHSQWQLPLSEIEVFTTKDSGPGGQHRNKTESCVVMRHRPTGIEAKASTRSQHQNRVLARAVLEGRVTAHFAVQSRQRLDQQRKQMIGSGERGDKIRTYRTQDNLAADHRSGRKVRLSDVMRGELGGLMQ